MSAWGNSWYQAWGNSWGSVGGDSWHYMRVRRAGR